LQIFEEHPMRMGTGDNTTAKCFTQEGLCTSQ
jgi:hypothetical protein